MAYVIQGYSNDPSDNGASITVITRREALAIATRWLGDGIKGVRIIGDGRIYSPANFAMTLAEPDTEG